MKSAKLETIVCPCCGREYLPAEIYLPNSFLGKPSNIIKTRDGKVDVFVGQSMDLQETYICDNCCKPFRVTAKVQFRTEYIQGVDFSSQYTTKLKEEKLHLFEG